MGERRGVSRHASHRTAEGAQFHDATGHGHLRRALDNGVHGVVGECLQVPGANGERLRFGGVLAQRKHRRVRHRSRDISNAGAELTQRLDDPLSDAEVTHIAHAQQDNQLADLV